MGLCVYLDIRLFLFILDADMNIIKFLFFYCFLPAYIPILAF